MHRVAPQLRDVTRVFRLALGLIVAFVFAGRVEAATQHCVRLAHEASEISEPAASPCHMMGMPETTKIGTHHGQAQHGQGMSACECVAFAKSVSTPPPLLATSRIAAAVWERPHADSLVSLDLVPEGPPPKA